MSTLQEIAGKLVRHAGAFAVQGHYNAEADIRAAATLIDSQSARIAVLEAVCMSVAAWWETHKYDTCSNGDDEYNVYDNTPEMVDLARAALAQKAGGA